MNTAVPRLIAFFTILLYLFARVYIPALDRIVSPFVALPGLVLIWGVIAFFLTRNTK